MDAGGSGGQSLSDSRAPGRSRTDGVSARLCLCDSAVHLEQGCWARPHLRGAGGGHSVRGMACGWRRAFGCTATEGLLLSELVQLAPLPAPPHPTSTFASMWEDYLETRNPDHDVVAPGRVSHIPVWPLRPSLSTCHVGQAGSARGLHADSCLGSSCGDGACSCPEGQALSVSPTPSHRETPAPREVVLHQTSGRTHNKNVSTHLIGNIRRGGGHSPESGASGLFALCTLDGTLKLMEEADKLLWSVQVDHQLFALEKLDVTGNGHEEVVACAWDGQTYIIDHNRTVVRFQVDENIRAFCAGLYACKEGRNSPCLVYVTFNQKIYVYWEVQLERMESTNLLKLLEAHPDFRSLLRELGIDPDDLLAARALLHQTLYHPDRPPQCVPTGLQDPT
nr:KICSTOR complex protein ITFG2 isoform X3 [Vicugna pacos]